VSLVPPASAVVWQFEQVASTLAVSRSVQVRATARLPRDFIRHQMGSRISSTFSRIEAPWAIGACAWQPNEGSPRDDVVRCVPIGFLLAEYGSQ
jgi:hypothetical protein